MVGYGRFGVIAATTGQLRYAVIRPSMYPRLMPRAMAGAPPL